MCSNGHRKSEMDSDDEVPSHGCKRPPEKWDYEKIARVPELASAFRAFAHRALCKESVCFLEEVTRYVHLILMCPRRRVLRRNVFMKREMRSSLC